MWGGLLTSMLSTSSVPTHVISTRSYSYCIISDEPEERFVGAPDNKKDHNNLREASHRTTKKCDIQFKADSRDVECGLVTTKGGALVGANANLKISLISALLELDAQIELGTRGGSDPLRLLNPDETAENESDSFLYPIADQLTVSTLKQWVLKGIHATLVDTVAATMSFAQQPVLASVTRQARNLADLHLGGRMLIGPDLVLDEDDEEVDERNFSGDSAGEAQAAKFVSEYGKIVMGGRLGSREKTEGKIWTTLQNAGVVSAAKSAGTDAEKPRKAVSFLFGVNLDRGEAGAGWYARDAIPLKDSLFLFSHKTGAHFQALVAVQNPPADQSEAAADRSPPLFDEDSTARPFTNDVCYLGLLFFKCIPGPGQQANAMDGQYTSFVQQVRPNFHILRGTSYAGVRLKSFYPKHQ